MASFQSGRPRSCGPPTTKASSRGSRQSFVTVRNEVGFDLIDGLEGHTHNDDQAGTPKLKWNSYRLNYYRWDDADSR